ncbi:MAG: hypothetical protein DWG83_00895 [Chloroflexi bacterium]|nr:DUF6157 family protein [Chloroflexota bacterium]MDA1240868.1 DUF6157 family protein [Chloroflexota bacterium]MQC19117.1 hypothetical protein [Chloroflexota bacterium]
MGDLNYYDTLITVANDCPVSTSVVPPIRGDRKTVAVLQYEMLAAAPFSLTQEDVLFESWYQRQPLEDTSEPEKARLRTAFFAKSQPCLRSSPLPKQYGWGLLFDSEGRVALCPMDSPEYRRLTDGDAGLEILKAMRNRRG